jgi:hypothetical protein
LHLARDRRVKARKWPLPKNMRALHALRCHWRTYCRLEERYEDLQASLDPSGDGEIRFTDL